MARYALLVIDMQNRFESCAKPILSEVNATIAACRKQNIPIVYTQTGSRYPEIDGGSMGRFWGLKELIIYGSDAWKLMDELDYKAEDLTIVEKRRYDAFH